MSQFDPKNLQRIPRKSKKKKPAAEAADDEALAEALSSKKKPEITPTGGPDGPWDTDLIMLYAWKNLLKSQI